uniref:ATP-dependent DNA helicase II subunit 2 n=1 Tax=Schizophyllum commune (strain H4-8 / FGSC 9210) TaxID=578458 RepID=D8QKI4_SCHCM
MPAERAGFTVTMFLIDVSKSMGKKRQIELPGQNPNDEPYHREITNLEWGLQFVKLKIQEMIYNGRKTDKCGVIIFGCDETNNPVNEREGGYENVSEYIPVEQPNSSTIAKLDELRASEDSTGDPMDALIVAVQMQDEVLNSKKTWTRKITIVTDGESPMELEDWEATVQKINELGVRLAVVGIDFDSEEYGYHQENKPHVKSTNENFWTQFTSLLSHGVVGTCEEALEDTAAPDVKETKSVLMSNVLRLGDVDNRPETALEIIVRTAKCTAMQRPKSWKKFAPRVKGDESEAEDKPDEDMEKDDDSIRKAKQAKGEDANAASTQDVNMDADDEDGDDSDAEEVLDLEDPQVRATYYDEVERETLVRGFKYGTSYAPCPEGHFPKLNTKKGIDFCAFFKRDNFRRELVMGEVQYIWADPAQPRQQIALSSIIRAMFKEKVYAIGRWVGKDGADPKMGVLAPCKFPDVDCLLWAPMPFADDVRKYTFPSLMNLLNKKGERVTEHPYIPTEAQCAAMDDFVDSMDLMEAGEKDDDGKRGQWFTTIESYNPALHRTKQAMFHGAVVHNLDKDPVPPPHPDIVRFFDPPNRVLRKARDALETAKRELKVKQVPKTIPKAKEAKHAHAVEEEDEPMLLGPNPPSSPAAAPAPLAVPAKVAPTDRREADDDEDEELLLEAEPSKPVSKPKSKAPLPTPPQEVDPGRAPDRIIGSVFPLDDFKANIARGDVVSKAVEDLAFVICEIVRKPFVPLHRKDELIECMRFLRHTCVTEDEVDAWNAFMRELKEACEDVGVDEFWRGVKEAGRELSLISDKEAEEHGGTSSVSEEEAQRVSLWHKSAEQLV